MRQRHIYAAIREAHAEKGYPIELTCELLHVARSAYHRWVSGKLSRRAAENETSCGYDREDPRGKSG